MSSINQNLSIFIPHMFPNITEERITNIFSNYSLGDVSRVDFVGKTDKNGKFYNAAYIHFDSWFDNLAVQNFQERVLNPEKEARIVYDDPWYWVVLENTSAPKVILDQSLVSADYAATLERTVAELGREVDYLKGQVSQLEYLLEENADYGVHLNRSVVEV